MIDQRGMLDSGKPTAPAPVAARSRNSRWLANAFCALFLGYQVGMPLRYYLGGHGYDERFSWRMFSSVRLQACRVRVEERVAQAGRVEERPVELEQDLQAAWVSALERLRPAVVEKYLSRRCERSHAQQVTLLAACRDTDGAALPERRLTQVCERAEPRQGGPR